MTTSSDDFQYPPKRPRFNWKNSNISAISPSSSTTSANHLDPNSSPLPASKPPVAPPIPPGTVFTGHWLSSMPPVYLDRNEQLFSPPISVPPVSSSTKPTGLRKLPASQSLPTPSPKPVLRTKRAVQAPSPKPVSPTKPSVQAPSPKPVLPTKPSVQAPSPKPVLPATPPVQPLSPPKEVSPPTPPVKEPSFIERLNRTAVALLIMAIIIALIIGYFLLQPAIPALPRLDQPVVLLTSYNAVEWFELGSWVQMDFLMLKNKINLP